MKIKKTFKSEKIKQFFPEGRLKFRALIGCQVLKHPRVYAYDDILNNGIIVRVEHNNKPIFTKKYDTEEIYENEFLDKLPEKTIFNDSDRTIAALNLLGYETDEEDEYEEYFGSNQI